MVANLQFETFANFAVVFTYVPASFEQTLYLREYCLKNAFFFPIGKPIHTGLCARRFLSKQTVVVALLRIMNNVSLWFSHSVQDGSDNVGIERSRSHCGDGNVSEPRIRQVDLRQRDILAR
jgi:hypothetical protein